MIDRLYILVPVHNRRETTRTFIHCLLDQTYTNWHLVLIDDGSVDGTAEMAAGLVNDLTVIKGDGSWWWAKSLQKGIEWLCSNKTQDNSIVLIINDDTEFDPHFLEKGMSVVASGRDLLVKPYGYDCINGHLVDAGICYDWFTLSRTLAIGKEEVNCFSTRGIFLMMSTLNKIGDFYPRLLPHYLSDYEYTIRAKRKGLRLMADSTFSLKTPDPAGNVKKMPSTFYDRLKLVVSNSYHRNPFRWFIFVCIAAPWRWKLWGILLVLYRGISDLTGICLPVQVRRKKQ